MTRVTPHADGRHDLTPDEMDRIFAAHIAGEAAHDLDAVMATFTPDAVHELVGDPTGELVGTAIADRYGTMFADFQATGVEPIRRLHGPRFLVDECVYKAIAIGNPFGIPGGNRPVEMRILHVLEFAEGRISHEIVWLDAAAVIAQLTAPAVETT